MKSLMRRVAFLGPATAATAAILVKIFERM